MPTKDKIKTEIEELEHDYLEQFYHFLKFAEKRILKGFETKEKIKEDWIEAWNPKEAEKEGEKGKGISSFAVGAERILYALLNSQGFGQPNSSPVGSDLFFETEDAFIHIDLKTVQTRNIGDYHKNIFVGDNQNSYKGKIKLRSGKERNYNPALPEIYKNSGDPKPCLTFFITILYDEKNLKTLNINILSMPNGCLRDVYGDDVLAAGKNPGKIRFNFSKVNKFELIDGKPARVKVVYFNEKDMTVQEGKEMKTIKDFYENQKKKC
jgi:hypothetical protein